MLNVTMFQCSNYPFQYSTFKFVKSQARRRCQGGSSKEDREKEDEVESEEEEEDEEGAGVGGGEHGDHLGGGGG